ARKKKKGTRATHNARARTSGRLQYGGGGLHLGETRRAALERKLVAAPEIHIPVFVDMGRRPGHIDGEDAPRERRRNQCRAGERGDRVDRTQPPWIARNGFVRGGKR